MSLIARVTEVELFDCGQDVMDDNTQEVLMHLIDRITQEGDEYTFVKKVQAPVTTQQYEESQDEYYEEGDEDGDYDEDEDEDYEDEDEDEE